MKKSGSKMKDKAIFALGFFDGVHLGHEALLNKARQLAAAHGCHSGAVTFGTHPDSLVLGQTPGLICTLADRERLLKARLETVITLPFDEEMCRTEWTDFLAMLRRDYGAAGFVCGDDFRFGAKGKGNADSLKAYCAAEKLPCGVVPEQTAEGVRISSTIIRKQLEDGDMATAVRFLGHPYLLTGQVVAGQQLGRRLGIPTANLHFPEELAVPRFGVYACRVKLDGIWHPAVTNIGTRPTVSGRGITVEPWILDYSGDLYGSEITLEFHFFLRPERKFASLAELQAEIRRNASQTREFFS